jgi:hypothetical protein
MVSVNCLNMVKIDWAVYVKIAILCSHFFFCLNADVHGVATYGGEILKYGIRIKTDWPFRLCRGAHPSMGTYIHTHTHTHTRQARYRFFIIMGLKMCESIRMSKFSVHSYNTSSHVLRACETKIRLPHCTSGRRWLCRPRFWLVVKYCYINKYTV